MNFLNKIKNWFQSKNEPNYPEELVERLASVREPEIQKINYEETEIVWENKHDPSRKFHSLKKQSTRLRRIRKK